MLPYVHYSHKSLGIFFLELLLKISPLKNKIPAASAELPVASSVHICVWIL